MFQMSAEVGLGLRLLTPQWLSGKESTCNAGDVGNAGDAV